MSHAEKCPVCGGSGKIYVNHGDNTTLAPSYEVCYGCGGKGWVTIHGS